MSCVTYILSSFCTSSFQTKSLLVHPLTRLKSHCCCLYIVVFLFGIYPAFTPIQEYRYGHRFIKFYPCVTLTWPIYSATYCQELIYFTFHVIVIIVAQVCNILYMLTIIFDLTGYLSWKSITFVLYKEILRLYSGHSCALPVETCLHSLVLLFYRHQIVTYSSKYAGLAGLQYIRLTASFLEHRQYAHWKELETSYILPNS